MQFDKNQHIEYVGEPLYICIVNYTMMLTRYIMYIMIIFTTTYILFVKLAIIITW